MVASVEPDGFEFITVLGHGEQLGFDRLGFDIFFGPKIISLVPCRKTNFVLIDSLVLIFQ